MRTGRGAFEQWPQVEGLTGVTHDGGRDAGAEGYLAKPVSIGPFMAAVKGLVERAV